MQLERASICSTELCKVLRFCPCGYSAAFNSKAIKFHHSFEVNVFKDILADFCFNLGLLRVIRRRPAFPGRNVMYNKACLKLSWFLLFPAIGFQHVSTRKFGPSSGICLSFLNRPIFTVKPCIKAAAYVQFFNFLVWLLFKCGLYLRAAYMQSLESAKPVKAVWHM